jgi:hypothetical protein
VIIEVLLHLLHLLAGSILGRTRTTR